MLTTYLIPVLALISGLRAVPPDAEDLVDEGSYDSGLQGLDQAIFEHLCPDYARYSRLRQ